MFNNLKDQAVELLDKIEAGEADALNAYIVFKEYADFLTACTKQIQEKALEEFEAYGEKEVNISGFKVSKRAGYYTYDLVQNSEYKELKGQLDALAKLLKQASKLGKAIIDEDTGEAFSPCPIKSGTKDSLVIKAI